MDTQSGRYVQLDICRKFLLAEAAELYREMERARSQFLLAERELELKRAQIAQIEKEIDHA